MKNKLSPTYEGPFIIIRRFSDAVYKIQAVSNDNVKFQRNVEHIEPFALRTTQIDVASSEENSLNSSNATNVRIADDIHEHSGLSEMIMSHDQHANIIANNVVNVIHCDSDKECYDVSDENITIRDSIQSQSDRGPLDLSLNGNADIPSEHDDIETAYTPLRTPVTNNSAAVVLSPRVLPDRKKIGSYGYGFSVPRTLI